MRYTASVRELQDLGARNLLQSESVAVGGVGELCHALWAWRTEIGLLCWSGRQARGVQGNERSLDVRLGPIKASTATGLRARSSELAHRSMCIYSNGDRLN